MIERIDRVFGKSPFSRFQIPRKEKKNENKKMIKKRNILIDFQTHSSNFSFIAVFYR